MCWDWNHGLIKRCLWVPYIFVWMKSLSADPSYVPAWFLHCLTSYDARSQKMQDEPLSLWLRGSLCSEATSSLSGVRFNSSGTIVPNLGWGPEGSMSPVSVRIWLTKVAVFQLIFLMAALVGFCSVYLIDALQSSRFLEIAQLLHFLREAAKQSW